jgi:hypothetical protein
LEIPKKGFNKGLGFADMANSKDFFKLVLAVVVSISFTACGGRLPSKPVAPGDGPAAPATPDPLPNPDPQNPNPQPSDVKPPANANPGEPGDGTGDLPHPQPPDPGQPQTDTDFFTLMKRFGFSKSKDELVAEIKKGVNLKITDWSPGTVKNHDKNIANKFKDSAKYFNPPLKDAQEYFQHSMKLAAKKDMVDFYVSVNFGPKKDTIDLLKVDAKTLEVLYFNKSGLISSYTQDNGKLLRLARFMLIPQAVYGAATTDRASSQTFPARW